MSVLLYKTITLKLKLERKKKRRRKEQQGAGPKSHTQDVLVVCWKTSDVELVLDSSFFFGDGANTKENEGEKS